MEFQIIFHYPKTYQIEMFHREISDDSSFGVTIEPKIRFERFVLLEKST